ncbi:MAG: aldehyde dehydrogenase family protein [Clostridiales bacterium]|nr:aldehyde dehydrogenase family protein [Clostridiales bacterium]
MDVTEFRKRMDAHQLAKAVKAQRQYQLEGGLRDISERKKYLKILRDMLLKNEESITAALKTDLSKSESEVFLTETYIIYQEIDYALKNIDSWTKAKKVPPSLSNLPSRNTLHPEPYGVVAVLAPWNYPVNLTLAPIVGALAAGNSVVLKGSRSSKYTSHLLVDLITTHFPPEVIYPVNPEIDYDTLLNQRYDYIFFTGSTTAAKKVMAKAAENLTPVTMELGGRSPCIVHSDADIKLAAKRIAWGKFLNAGQTCISINHVWVHEDVENKFIKAILDEILLNYRYALQDPDYPKIISKNHFDRLSSLIDTAEVKPDGLVLGGERNEKDLKIAPTIVAHADPGDQIMEKELFGPILPILKYQSLDSLTHHLLEEEKPLACYFFTEDIPLAYEFMNRVSFGGGCINDVIMHISNHHMPFGGVGNSGMGSYHGKYSFDTFTHYKPVVSTSTLMDLPFRYSNFAKKNLSLLRKILLKP